MLQRLKIVARDALPRSLQVPVKYYYGRVRGMLEPEMAFLPYLVGRGERALDIGGNRGTYAFALARLGARVEVFEPNPACIMPLRHWARRHSNVVIHPVALSAHNGSARLHIPVGADGVEHDASASIEKMPKSAVHDIEVELRTLDSFGFDDVSFVKMDVEGHEGSVLDGASATLAANCPAILAEIEQRHNDRPISEIFNKIEAAGYAGFFMAGGKLRPLDTFDPERHQPIAALGKADAYHNNFIFLGVARLREGRYRAFEDRWFRP